MITTLEGQCLVSSPLFLEEHTCSSGFSHWVVQAPRSVPGSAFGRVTKAKPWLFFAATFLLGFESHRTGTEAMGLPRPQMD